ncbi:MAG: hypothetical protein MJ223_03405 [Mycoplasmoidaceae bacterium]|nr:hypothetical protein [Mycoplasmoidaceae bacterium]
MLQLVSQLTNVNLFKVGVSETVKYTVDNFADLFYGLTPSQIVDSKAICGDGSDNFCGIKGIGPKTAANLLKKYNCFSNIYAHIDELAAGQKQKFIENKASGKLCYQIATIKKDLFGNRQLDEFIKNSCNYDQFIKLCNE